MSTTPGTNGTATTGDVAIQVTTQICLFLLVFGFAATSNFEDFKLKLKKPTALLVGISLQFLLMPLVGFITASIYPLRDAEKVILVIVMSSPGGSYSNLINGFLNGDLALSVAMTTASTLSAVFMLPLNSLIYVQLALETEAELDWIGLGTSVGIVVTAVSVGLYAGNRFPTMQDKFNWVGQFFGLATIILSLTATGGDTDEPLWAKPAYVYAAVCTPGVFALFFSNFIGLLVRLTKPEVVTCSIETCFQNTGIALAMSFASFPFDEAVQAAAIPILYGGFQAVLVVTYALIAWKAGWTLAPPPEPFFKMLFGNYQHGARKLEETELEAVAELEVGNHKSTLSQRFHLRPWSLRDLANADLYTTAAATAHGNRNGSGSGNLNGNTNWQNGATVSPGSPTLSVIASSEAEPSLPESFGSPESSDQKHASAHSSGEDA